MFFVYLNKFMQHDILLKGEYLAGVVEAGCSDWLKYKVLATDAQKQLLHLCQEFLQSKQYIYTNMWNLTIKDILGFYMKNSVLTVNQRNR